MAKSDSFFIRATVDFNGTTFTQATIDLGAYVDALGKSVLRIHNIATQYGMPLNGINPDANNTGYTAAFQLTTQSQSATISMADKSVIAGGTLFAQSGANDTIIAFSDDLDVAPQDWRNGYLIATENIYLGVDTSSATALGLTSFAIVLECTVETMSQAAAMALALSQQ